MASDSLYLWVLQLQLLGPATLGPLLVHPVPTCAKWLRELEKQSRAVVCKARGAHAPSVVLGVPGSTPALGQ